ncbi:hypothetical protein [Paroceanicella profunda]|nr:hypothetical protein [Paroceanicella profunda]
MKDMLVIRSGVSTLPVPLSALPEGMSPEALQARIEGHVAAAKVF